MSAFVKHLSTYADYHRDRRNVATHMVGIPVIVLSILILTSRPAIGLGDVVVTPAMLLSVPSALFYLSLDRGFGAVMAALLAVGCWLGLAAAQLSTPAWLAVGIGAFVGGWILQFVGHYWEGRKPAFLDDLSGLIIGPLFVVVEIALMLGLRPDLRRTLHEPASA